MFFIQFLLGFFNNKAINLIGNGVVIDPVIFENEIDGLQNLILILIVSFLYQIGLILFFLHIK